MRSGLLSESITANGCSEMKVKTESESAFDFFHIVGIHFVRRANAFFPLV
jgi:hypothetical protein